MNANGYVSDMIVDDEHRKLFKVNRRAFVLPEVLEAEKQYVFDKCWIYAGHESEIPEPGDYRVRRNAALTLAKIGPEAGAAVPAILPLLGDENRYNRFYGGLALRRIGTVRAGEALLDSLFESRWCPLTSTDDMY